MGQPGSLSSDNVLTVFKILTGISASLVTLFLHLLLELSAEIILTFQSLAQNVFS